MAKTGMMTAMYQVPGTMYTVVSLWYMYHSTVASMMFHQNQKIEMMSKIAIILVGLIQGCPGFGIACVKLVNNRVGQNISITKIGKGQNG